MKGSFISFALSSVLVGGVVWGSDITLDLTPPKEGETTKGYPVEFKYTYDKDGKKETSIDELKSETDYFWSKDSGSTLSLKEKKQASGSMSNLVATAVFIAPGNNDNLLLENFNYISVGADTITEKGKNDTYFAIQSGPNSYTSFTLNGANIFSGSNLHVGGIAANSSASGANNITGGFKDVYLKGTIKVDANAIDQADSAGSGSKNATLNFSSEYNGATYTIDSSATLDLTSSGNNTSTVNFNKGIVKYDTNTSKDVFATDQSVLNKGNIKISNTTANTTAGTPSEEKNNINFHIDLKNEGTITLENATLTFKDSGLIISDSGSVGTIDIKAKTDTKDKLSSNQTNKSTLYFDSTDTTTAKAFEIASQKINITGIAPSDASSSESNQELFGSQLTIKVNNSGIPSGGAKDLILTGAKDKLTAITIGASASSGTVNDKNTSLIFDSDTVSMDNYVGITVQSGAKLDLTQIKGTSRTYTDSSSSGANKNTILDFHNQGTITFKGDGVNTNILDASRKKIILTDYATTKTTCKVGDTDCSKISDVNNIPKNATLTTTEEESAGTMEISGGKTTIQADVAYNFGNLKISNSGTLDLSKIAKKQDGTNGSVDEVGFVNAGVLTSTGGVIDTRTTQEDTTKTGNDIDYDAMNVNKKNTGGSNTKKLIITEAKKEKVNDTRDSGIDKDGSTKLKEGESWAANKDNETRAEFVVDSGATTIRASSLINKGLTTIQNGGTLNLYCVGTDYCYDGRYWTNFTKDSQGVWYIMKPEEAPSSTSPSATEKLKATQLVFDNDTTGAIILSGGTLNAIDSYKYQEKDDSGSYKDVTKYIYHSLKITGGELGASGGVNSIIRVGYGDTSAGSGANNNYLTLENVNLSLRGDSKLFIISEKDEDTTSSAKADVTWKAGTSNNNTFTMYLGDDDYTKNTRGIYILGLADSDGNYKGGTINFTDNGGSSSKLPKFVIDLSDLSGKNTILLNKQYNFLVAGQIQSGGSKITDASKITMEINFGKGANTKDGTDKPASDTKDYGIYDQTLCANDSKFCLEAKDTNKNGSVSDAKITIGNSNNNEGVVVVDKSDSSKLSDITNGWPNGSNETYADFVTFNKVYEQGSGTCDFNTLEGCAVIGFSAVKSKTLQKDGVSAVFQSIKDRYNQLPNTQNEVIKNTLAGINLIESANANASTILQSIVDTDGVASSSILLNLQKFQYTGDLDLANQVAKDLNTLDNSLDAISNVAQESLELISRVNFTSTLNTSARLAQNSNPYRMNTSFAKAIKSLENKKFADISDSLYSYTDRFDFDHNAWAMAIGGFGGKYSGGYNALGGISAGYDRMLGRVLLGGYATYAYALSSLNSFNNDSTVKTDNSSHNLEIGAYLRAYVDAHEIDVILSETLGFNSLDLKNSLTSQNLKFDNFTTNLTARYGYVIPLNVDKGLYIKPLVGLNYMYQYNTQVNGSTDVRINANAKHSNAMTLSAFAEVRKYVDDKKYLYIMPGIEQDVFAISGDSQVYFANSANNILTYKVDNVVRTYLTVIGGGEIGIKDNMAITFGMGAKISWDRYFINGNVGFKYKFNSN
ncbi:hypothetical protein CQA57_00960 [Helicobacter anseris]|uniref:Autotransporter domain-containing protein n=1 Tax=Helicobacter anseris TaxID=375926 RepID=A0A3D8JB76_9HELI|nr:autotransporter outer membrane beta-barrel domain-containing protein [Helicobacter anseris]RDU74652.1 hypothetical protein CQA57_00960 [Helicobacter anseris]